MNMKNRKKENWIWMPHAGHLIVGSMCQFTLSTYIGKYIISTVGEYWPDKEVRKIHAKIFDKKWYDENCNLKGDNFDHAYMKKFGYEDIGVGKKYETMVFEAKKSNDKCCLYEIIVEKEVETLSYNIPEEARKGHLKLCNKWSKK